MRQRLNKQAIRRGAVAPLTAFLMVFILGLIAFALDLGYIALVRTEAQDNADAAALAGMNKLLERLKTAPIRNGKPQQTASDLQAAKDEAKAVALLNKIGGQEVALLDSDIEVGYLSNPYDQTYNTLDTSGWPNRPYNAVRVKTARDKNHAGGSLKLFFAPVLGVSTTEVSATGTACFVMGTVTPKGNTSSGYGGILPFTYQVDDWNAAVALGSAGSVLSSTGATILVNDNYKVDRNSSSTSGVSFGSDSLYEIKLYPNSTTSGNFGTINFTLAKSSNSTSVLRDLIQYGPAAADWPDLPTILKATSSNPVSVNGDPGISAGMDSALQAVIGQPRILPLYSSVSGNGNNTFYNIVGYVPITIVAADLHSGTKYIHVQPRLINKGALMDGTNKIDFDITPGANPNPLLIGARALVR